LQPAATVPLLPLFFFAPCSGKALNLNALQWLDFPIGKITSTKTAPSHGDLDPI